MSTYFQYIGSVVGHIIQNIVLVFSRLLLVSYLQSSHVFENWFSSYLGHIMEMMLTLSKMIYYFHSNRCVVAALPF